jgi:hypothetical protein
VAAADRPYVIQRSLRLVRAAPASPGRCTARRGWRVATVHPGDDYRVSGSWELHRSGSAPILIDFDGMGPDGDRCLPLDESYGCQVRGRASASLYFRRVNRSRELWQAELAGFVQKLDTKA